MAADPNNAVFFPATLLYLLRPFSTAARSAHLLWAFAFPIVTFAALRRLGLSRFSAVVGALALAWSGPAMTLASLPTTAWAIALFLPLLAAAVSGEGAASRAGAAALFTGLIVLSGEPAIAGEALVLALLFLLCERRMHAATFAAGAVAGLAIAAPQIVSAVELLGGTVRRAGLAAASGAAYYSVRPARLFAALWPGIFGDVHSASAAGFWGSAFFDAGAPYVSTLAVGTATLALIPAALTRRRGRTFVVLATVSAVFSFGRFLPGGARILALPGFSLVRYPEKWLLFSAVAAIAAAGFALDRIRAGDRKASRRAAQGAAAAAFLSWGAWAWTGIAPGQAWSSLLAGKIVAPGLARDAGAILPAVRSELALTGAFAAVMVLCCLGLARRPAVLAATVSALLLVDLFPRTWNSVPLETGAYYDSPPAEAAAIARAGGRFYFDGETEVAPDALRPLRPAMWGVAYAGNNDIDRFSPRRSFLFGRALASLSFSDPRKSALLRLADVSAFSTIDPSSAGAGRPLFATSARRVVLALPGGSRFRLLPAAMGASDEEEARRLILEPGFRPDETVVLEGATGVVRESPSAPASVVPRARRPDLERVGVVSGGGILLRAETYDPRWKARIDGRPARVMPADFAFQAVAVPAGAHEIEFVYSDPATLGAMVCSLAGLLLAAMLLTRRTPGLPGRSQRRRSGAVRESLPSTLRGDPPRHIR
jgi:hypothetical protein